MLHYSFKRHQRLLNSKEFKKVFDQANIKVSHPFYLLLALGKEENSVARLGLVVGKKNLRLAVQRNAFKRHVRESFRLHQHQLGGLDIIVLARRGCAEQGFDSLQTELAKSWKKLAKKASRTQNAAQDSMI